MRRPTRTLLAAMLCLATAAAARAQDRQAFVEGFGGVNVSAGPLGGVSNSSFGGAVGVNLTPNIQAIGEAGRLSNVMPSSLQTLLSLTPVDFRLSAWYGQGGIRLSAGNGILQPYAETVAGVARLTAHMHGLGAADPWVNTGLAFMSTTRPIATVGGGVVVRGGPVLLDVGYRFNRIFTNESLAGALTGGDVGGHQLRAGIGVSF